MERQSRRRGALILAGAALVTAAGVGGAAALSGDDDDRDRAIPGGQIERAKDAALDETGGGTVTGTEVDDEESKYEVEVTLDDGTRVDVQLDEGFRVVGTEGDDATEQAGSDDG